MPKTSPVLGVAILWRSVSDELICQLPLDNEPANEAQASKVSRGLFGPRTISVLFPWQEELQHAPIHDARLLHGKRVARVRQYLGLKVGKQSPGALQGRLWLVEDFVLTDQQQGWCAQPSQVVIRKDRRDGYVHPPPKMLHTQETLLCKAVIQHDPLAKEWLNHEACKV